MLCTLPSWTDIEPSLLLPAHPTPTLPLYGGGPTCLVIVVPVNGKLLLVLFIVFICVFIYAKLAMKPIMPSTILKDSSASFARNNSFFAKNGNRNRNRNRNILLINRCKYIVIIIWRTLTESCMHC